MMRRILLSAVALYTLTMMPIMAESSKEAEPIVTVDNQFVTNYVFRGDDIFKNQWVQDGKRYGSAGTSGAYQPSITFTTPIDGLTFNILGNFALANRKDKDVDGALQTAPSGTDLISTNCDAVARNCSTLSSAIVASAPTNLTLDSAGRLPMPGFHKEQVGLYRQDEMDLTIDYTKLTKAGKFNFGLIHYSLLNPVAKANPWSNAGATYYSTEMYVGYALEKFPDLVLKVNSDVINSNQYWSLGYNASKAITEKVNLLYGVTSGYAVRQNIQGWQDVTGKVGLGIGAFTVGFNFAHRPDLTVMEAIMGQDPNTRVPVELDGRSTVYDGRVADPSRNSVVDRLVNKSASTTTYTYTPRQKLPKTLFWLNAGYSATF